MPTIEEIKLQISNIKHLDRGDKIFGYREIRELPNILTENEIIENLIQGDYDDGNGILVATNSRVIFVNKKIFGELKIDDFQYNSITKVQCKKVLFWWKIFVYSSNKKVEISNIEKSQALIFTEFLNNKISSLKHNNPKNMILNLESNNSDDVLFQLERLSKLKEKGILTDEEFKIQKQKILNS